VKPFITVWAMPSDSALLLKEVLRLDEISHRYSKEARDKITAALSNIKEINNPTQEVLRKLGAIE